jgi:isopropylmalate/homocitrate/citramalate synthase
MDEVVIVDTLGVATPETMFYLTRKLREWVKVPIMTHCHSDFGMAAACTLFSVKAGATCAHVTINGLGEKTGNSDLAETVFAAKLYGMETNINMKKLYPAAKLVEKLKIPSPLKRSWEISCSNGKVSGSGPLITIPCGEPYSPELVGREREILMSKKSGKGLRGVSTGKDE